MENKTAEERFCKVYTEFYGVPIDKAEQIAEHRFNGNELMEFCEFYASQQLAEKDKEIDRLKKSLEGLLDGVDTFCKTIPAQMTSEAIYLWEKRTEAHESLNK